MSADTDRDQLDIYLYQLVLSLQAGAMQAMGKIASPVTGKIERNLELARNSVDMLDMLKRKTQGNLSSEEEQFIDHVLFELRMNFVDESKKKEESTEQAPDEERSPDSGNSNDQETGDSEDKPPAE